MKTWHVLLFAGSLLVATVSGFFWYVPVVSLLAGGAIVLALGLMFLLGYEVGYERRSARVLAQRRIAKELLAMVERQG